MIDKATAVITKHRFVYLSMQVRTGKTLTSLGVAQKLNVSRVLFVTKKKAISSIEDDYTKFGYNQHFDLVVINDESMHKLNDNYDLVIHDEHHRFGSFPKPSKGAKEFKNKYY